VHVYNVGEPRPYVLTGVWKDIRWNDYGGIRNSERVRIDIFSTRIINIYHHRDQIFNIQGLKEEHGCSKQSKWACAGDFNCHHSLWDGNGREPVGSWREVKKLIEFGRLMIEPDTPTWKCGNNHRKNTIDFAIASDSANISMVAIAWDLYTGSDHETLGWEIVIPHNDFRVYKVT
jgi:hypothetical protein